MKGTFEWMCVVLWARHADLVLVLPCARVINAVRMSKVVVLAADLLRLRR